MPRGGVGREKPGIDQSGLERQLSIVTVQVFYLGTNTWLAGIYHWSCFWSARAHGFNLVFPMGLLFFRGPDERDKGHHIFVPGLVYSKRYLQFDLVICISYCIDGYGVWPPI